MTKSVLSPVLDPTPLFEYFRGSYGSELLTAAVSHFGLFELLSHRPMSLVEIQQELNLQRRPAIVLLTAMRAMQLLDVDKAGRYHLSGLAVHHLLSTADHFVGDYIGLAAESPGVLEMVARLRSNRPAHAKNDDAGAAFIFREGLESAMEQESSGPEIDIGPGWTSQKRRTLSGEPTKPDRRGSARSGGWNRDLQHRLPSEVSPIKGDCV